jgi:aspartyl-tRNA(Asn)/glutamyl-tRNA(Gln) amidotransferase subunit C
MDLRLEDVTRIAQLARISIAESEKENLLKDLNGIVKWIDQLSNLDINLPQEEILSTTPMNERVDQVTETNLKDGILLNAPALQHDMLMVPKVVES